MFAVDEFLADQGYSVKWASSGGELLTRCPECGRDKLYVNSQRGLCFCQRCQFKGNLTSLVAAVAGIEPREARSMIGFQETESFVPRQVVRVVGACSLPEGFQVLDDVRDHRQLPYWDYLFNKRNVRSDLIRRYGIGYCDHGYYAGRVVVPVTKEDELVHWVARDIFDRTKEDPQFKKVLTPRGNNQSAHLFNVDVCETANEVVITEGVFDALRAPETCVATFGKRLSPQQRTLLVQAGVRKVVVAWDADARTEACQLACDLNALFDVRVARLGAKDPGEMNVNDFRAAIREAQPVGVADFLMARTAAWKRATA